jgi:Xaa-Pro aminopeptidase
MAVGAQPAPFTAEDFARRMGRAADQADAAGLTGVLVTPGPDLVYLAGYAPVAITERLTLLALQKGREPAMVLPSLERPDAESAPSGGAIALTDWVDGTDPFAMFAPALDSRVERTRSPTPARALQLLGLQQALPGTHDGR